MLRSTRRLTVLNSHLRSQPATVPRVRTLMMGGNQSIPSKEECLPGRANEMRITNKHFVKGTPIKEPFAEGLKSVTFGNGCFWGSEQRFWEMPGVSATAVGYCGGHSPNPTYEEACSGRSGHTEAVRVVYDPSLVSFADLLKMFWESHNPTQGMGQGNDRGTQYRSGIYTTEPEQTELARASKGAYQAALGGKGISTAITTEIVEPSGAGGVAPPVFYYAEDCHQQYLAKPGARPYCSAAPTGAVLPAVGEWGGALAAAHANLTPQQFWADLAPSCSLFRRPGGKAKENKWLSQ